VQSPHKTAKGDIPYVFSPPRGRPRVRVYTSGVMVGVFLMFRREARGEKSVKIGEQNLLLPLFSARPGEEERLQSRSKRHHFELFFF